jgi:hypothetical protein
MPIRTPHLLPNEGIWRYLTLEKLLALLQKNTLHFARMSEFDVPFEGHWPIAVTTGPIAVGVERPEPVPWVHLRDEEIKSETYLSCWHVNKYESTAMWSLYSGKSGVAVKSTIDRLTESLRKAPQEILMALVTYKAWNPGAATGSPWTMKKPSYEHEKELRAAIRDPNHKHVAMAVPVDVELLLERIYVSPLAEDWKVDVVKDVVKKYGYEGEVKKSPLHTLP